MAKKEKQVKKEKEPGKEKGGSSKVILIVIAAVIGLVLVAGAVFIGYMAATKSIGSGSSEKVQQEKKVEEFTFKLEQFLVNLKDENKSKFLKIDMYLGGDVENKDLEEELKKATPQIRDIITKTLRSKLSTDFTSEGETLLKEQLKSSINGILTKGQITNVYFTDLIVQ